MARLLGAFTHNWQLKLLALALAVLLWVVVSAEQIESNWIPVSLQVEVNDPDYRVVPSSAPREVQVRFSGPRRELWDLAIERPPLLLRVSGVGDTVQVLDLDPGMVLVPNGLSVNPQAVRPARVRLRFEHLSVRSVPVQVKLANTLGPDYTLVDSLVVEPSRVDISGLATQVAGVERVETVPISLPTRSQDFAVLAPLETAPLHGLKISAARVRVSGRVERVVDRTIASVPISVGPGVVVHPGAVDVVLRGAEGLVGPLRPADFRVVIAIDSIPERLPPEGMLVPLRVDGVPAGVTAAAHPRAARLMPTRAPADSAAQRGGRADSAAARRGA
ncbi:MAG TPA: YbbR-like domain-containing protein [Longimicrobiaceae bacterium]|nr:YbbR-like domain-containing protein [Longimicrobiaceae bacterium]